jgi:hypothetical protein
VARTRGSLLRSHARRLNRLYTLDGAPVFGISVFIAYGDVGAESEKTILSRKLGSYPTIYRTSVGQLHVGGPTARRRLRRAADVRSSALHGACREP